MTVFYLRLKMHTQCASAFHMWLLKAGRKIGIAPTSMMNDSQDMDQRDPDFQVYAFVCQAEATLKPRQLLVLFTECERIKAEVLEIAYQKTEYEEDESDYGEGWHELVRTVKMTTDPPVVVRRLRASPFLTHLRLVWSAPDDNDSGK